MLIYTYKCKKCGKEYYYRTDTAYNGESIRCPDCGAEDFDLSAYEPLSQERSGQTASPFRFG
jgi:putative FmdB family regulatory protein